FYLLTRKLHAKVTCGSNTVCGNLKASPIVPGFVSAGWQRWSRPRGAIGRLQGRPAVPGFVSDLLEQLNDCKRPAPRPDPPGGLHPPVPGDGPVSGGIPCNRIEELISLGSEVLLQWGLFILWVVRHLLVNQNG